MKWNILPFSSGSLVSTAMSFCVTRLIVYIDWESFEHNAEWVNSKEQTLLMANLAQIFDLESGAPFKRTCDNS